MDTCQTCSRGNLCTSSIPLFQSLDYRIQEKLASSAKHVFYKKGDRIFSEGDSCDRIYIVHQGKIKLSAIDPKGKENIIDILLPGDSLGEDRFLGQGQFPFDALCLEDTATCQIDGLSFRQVFAENPQAFMDLIAALSEKIKGQEEKIILLSENDTAKRLASFLLMRSRRISASTIELSIEDIAASINLRAETISRKIQVLRDLGLVKREGKSKITILDIEKLKEYVKNS